MASIGHVAGRGVKMWRHLPTWRQGARWRGRTWRQNVASLAHVASGSQVAWPDVASKRGVTCPRSVAGRGVKTWRHWPTRQGSQVAWPDVALKCGVTGRVREPRAVAEALPALTRVASLCVAERGVKMWRHLPTWRQGATWRRRTWRQNVASGAIDLRGVTGRGVKTWRHEARPPGHVSSKCVFSRRAICAPPQATALFHYIILYYTILYYIILYYII